MEIQSLSAEPSTFSSYQNFIREGPFQTTWKTHVHIVLSYLLIGIGIALACASVYMATVVHPMLAMASPIGPIALGILIRPESSSGLISAASAPVYIKGQPLGLSNPGNDCWMNASFQIVSHTFDYTKLMQEITQESNKKLLRFFGLFPLITAFKNYQAELQGENGNTTCSSVSSTTLRQWFSRINKHTSAKDTQEDPMTFFGELHNRSGKFLPLMQQKNKGKARTRPDFYIPLLMQPKAKNSFNELFNGYFSEYIADSGTHLVKWFSTAPKGFLVQASRYAQNNDGTYSKIADKMDFPMQLELTEKQCKQGLRNYVPDAFIVHEGSSIESGHYTSYVQRDGYWWHINDASVRQISDSEAKSALKDAYIVHYTQVEMSHD